MAGARPPTLSPPAFAVAPQWRTSIDPLAAGFVQTEGPSILKDALQGGFGRSSRPSLCASFAFALILAMIVAIAALLGTDLSLGVRKAP